MRAAFFFPVAIALGLIALLLLSGCATVAPSNAAPVDPLVVLSAFTADDLNAALADANAHNDVAAVMCYTTLLRYVGMTGHLPAVPKGIFSANQIKRDLLRGGANKVQEDLTVGCAAYVSSEIDTLVKLGALGASVVK